MVKRLSRTRVQKKNLQWLKYLPKQIKKKSWKYAYWCFFFEILHPPFFFFFIFFYTYCKVPSKDRDVSSKWLDPSVCPTVGTFFFFLLGDFFHYKISVTFLSQFCGGKCQKFGIRLSFLHYFLCLFHTIK
jgi:hypothetical protein